MTADKKRTRKTSGSKTGSTRARAASAVAGADAMQVRGRIVSASGAPAAGLTAIAFDKDVAGEHLLGKALTAADGTYQIPYTDLQFRLSKNEQRGADVFVRVYDG